MTTEHPITPSPKLVHKWCEIWNESDDEDAALLDYISVRAAQWGADQELEACLEWIDGEIGAVDPNDLRAARRPKPLSLKKQALAELEEWENIMDIAPDSPIRRALETLPND